jgi:hypothetical protein
MFTDCTYGNVANGPVAPLAALSSLMDAVVRFSTAFYVLLALSLVMLATLVSLVAVVVRRRRARKCGGARNGCDGGNEPLGPISAVSLGDIDRRVGGGASIGVARRRLVKRNSSSGRRKPVGTCLRGDGGGCFCVRFVDRRTSWVSFGGQYSSDATRKRSQRSSRATTRALACGTQRRRGSLAACR